MTVTDVASTFVSQQRATATATAAAVATRWNRIDPDDIISSWRAQLVPVVALVAAAQARAARDGAAYTPAAVRQQGLTPRPAGDVVYTALAGVASDGRPLDTLLDLPAIQTVRRIGDGAIVDDALAQSRRHMMMLAATQVFDAGRIAAGLALTADRTVNGYRRQLRGTSCSRCIVLAGAWYRFNEGFLRHPQDDCVHVPAVGPKSDLDGLEGFDPKAHFDALDEAAQDRTFTQAGAQAIRDGADIGQVVNARRGMRTTTAYGRRIHTTTVGTSRRASGGRAMERTGVQFSRQDGSRYRIARSPRLMPEQIYVDAAGDRDEAIRLLGRFGYLA